MVDRRRWLARLLVPHLLVVPLVARHVHRDAARTGHPDPRRAALRYGPLGLPGLLLYETDKRRCI